MFQFPAFAYHNYLFIMTYMVSTPCGFPHSDTSRSLTACVSLKLFAACRVLLRLLVPRHPPYALSIFTYFVFYPGFLLLSSLFQISLKRAFS